MLKEMRFYPALVVETFDHPDELRARFEDERGFELARASVVQGLPFPFDGPPSIAADPDAACVLVPLTDGKVCACLYFLDHMRGTQEEAQALAEELTAQGESYQGGTVLVMGVDVTQTGRA